jgi:hypothetical protein
VIMDVLKVLNMAFAPRCLCGKHTLARKHFTDCSPDAAMMD